jgi:predicted RNA-binding protein YlxR (DUF448 family)
VIDPTGKLAGRGAYLHLKHSCFERGIKGALATAFKAELTPAECEQLIEFSSKIPD